MNKDARINEIKSLVMSKRIDKIRLNETKIKRSRLKEVKEKLEEDWEIYLNSNRMEAMEGDSI